MTSHLHPHRTPPFPAQSSAGVLAFGGMPLLAVAESRYRWAYGPSGQRRVISWVQVGREGRHASIGSSDFFLCVKFDFELLLGRDAQAQQSFSQQTLAINQPLRKLSLLPQQATEGREGIGLHLSDFLQSTHANKPSAPPGAGPGRELEHDVKDGKDSRSTNTSCLRPRINAISVRILGP